MPYIGDAVENDIGVRVTPFRVKLFDSEHCHVAFLWRPILYIYKIQPSMFNIRMTTGIFMLALMPEIPEEIRSVKRLGYLMVGDQVWSGGSSAQHYLAVDIFMVIRDRAVYKKLTASHDYYTETNFADGREIQKAINPSWRSFAFYWLDQSGVRSAFRCLEDAGLIEKRMRGRAPYGYGDDEQYHLLTPALLMMRKSTGRRNLQARVQMTLEDFHYEAVWGVKKATLDASSSRIADELGNTDN